MKKLLSIILVLAMLLGMTAMPAFATDSTVDEYVAKGSTKTYTSSAADPEGGANTYFWTADPSTDVTLTNAATKTVSVEFKNENTDGVTISCQVNNGAASVVKKVAVVDTTKYDLEKESNPQTTVSVKGTITLAPTLKYGEAAATGNALKAITISASSDATSVATAAVNSNGTVEIVGKANGEATITVTAKLGTSPVDEALTYKVTVSGISLESEIENSLTLDTYEDEDELLDFILEEVNDKFDLSLDEKDIASLKIKENSVSCGQLYLDDKVDDNASKVTDVMALTENGDAKHGVSFVGKKGAIGKNVYNIELTTNSSAEDGAKTYYGTWTINVTAYDEIDEEEDALFALESYSVDLPSGIKYIKVVENADSYEGVYTSSSTGMSSRLTFDPSSTKYEKKGNNAILYVVGLDSAGRAYTGTITLDGATYDIKYIGEKDEEIQMVKKDFEGILEDIFDEQYTGTSTDYVTLTSVTFPGSSSKNYEVYNGTKKLSSSAKVDEDDISDVSVKPLKSAEHFLTVTLTGTVYDKNDKAKSTSYSKKAVVLISAVAGDVKYTVVGNSAVYLDADDFQDFYEDAKNSSSAVLSYITIDPSDLKSTDGVFYVTKTAKLEDDDKLWADEDDTTTRAPYTIDKVRFVAGKSLANGTKIYIPFTASGKKGAENGYIEIEVINNPFTDVKSTDYFYDSALWAVGKGITKGTNVAGTLFSPAQGCTRAQVVTFLYRAAGSPSITSSMRAEVAKFTDVNTTKHKDFIDAIAWAKYYGITSGTSATTFGPDKTCTRAQIVTFIANYVNKVEGKSVTPIYSNQFTDVKPTTTHKSYAAAIQWAVEKGITKGTNAAGTLFSPDATCTRGQVVTFLYNYFK